MSTTEDFENAPIGATATHGSSRAMKMYGPKRYWILQNGLYLNAKEMEQWGYTLDPTTPTTAREALDLAWELAEPVKEGQEIPKGTRILRRVHGSIREYQAGWDFDAATPFDHLRTLDPLPEPEPDWLDALAVLATTVDNDNHRTFANVGNSRWQAPGEKSYPWTDLTDVTPLYPKGQDA